MGTGLTTLSVDVMVTRAVMVTDIDNNLTINAPTNFDANARVRYRIKQGTGGKTLTFVGFASTGGYTDAATWRTPRSCSMQCGLNRDGRLT